MRFLRPLGLIVCVALFSAACSAGSPPALSSSASSLPASSSPVSSSPVVSSPSSGPPDDRAGNGIPCKAFDEAVTMLSDSAAGTAPGLKMDEKKLVAALQRYATALDKVKALANDPELTEALRIDAESARFIAQLWKTSGLPDYKGWTEYRIAPRSRVPGRCLPEWLPKYEGLQKIWLASLAGG